jgi:hypothetical protein
LGTRWVPTKGFRVHLILLFQACPGALSNCPMEHAQRL